MAAQCLWAPPAGVDELWGQVLMELDRIPKEVCRNLVESMPRRMQAMARAKEGKLATSTKTGSSSVGHCKSCIKSIHEANVLTFGINRTKILSFVIENSHEFSFVI